MKTTRSSEITPESAYLSRRRFMTGAAKLLAGGALLSACGTATPAPLDEEPGDPSPTSGPDAALSPTEGVEPSANSEEMTVPTAGQETDELGNSLTSFEAVTGYNNYYEFSLRKEEVAPLAKDWVTTPWTVRVGGLVNDARTFDLDDLRAFEVEERVYRMRCVEAWSMVIPWLGFPLWRLLEVVEPMSKAKYVRFETALDEKAMPGLGQPFPWPYVEGLRLDEAMHDLTILSTGLYGKDLEPQNGAPIRLVVPWKYGFKSLKSIVKIDLVEEMPTTFWAGSGRGEYGFWANVNPEVPHPRWSQASERIIGGSRRVPTLFLNGYAEEVAGMYDNLDARDWYF